MFERFTDRARSVVKGAVKASEELGHRHVGTEHLLLGLMTSGGVAQKVLEATGMRADWVRGEVQRFIGQDAEALESIGIDLDAVKAKIEETFGAGALDDLEPKPRRGWFRRRSTSEGGHRPFTPRAKKVLELSLREALALRHNYIGTEHILLGLLREGKGLAAKVMVDTGLDFVELRDQTIAAIPAK
ncbi:MAG TPA: Clp protease [Micromonosporaceae bacterium]|nr:Clp protease [Micromonosporaceae bacterium]